MRVIVVADRCGPSPADSATAAARHVRAGWLRSAPHDEVTSMGLSDGGAGFVEVMGAIAERSDPVVVTGHRGNLVPAHIVWRGDTAYVEAAHVAGLHLDPGARPGSGATSAGVAELLVAARAAGAQRIVVGVDAHLLCHDGGRGMLESLGAGHDLQQLPQVCREWAGTPLVMATAAMMPLTGFHGASAALTTELGVSALQAQEQEGTIGRFTEVVNGALRESLSRGPDLLSGAPRRREREPGAGAGGGVGYALQMLGAATVPGAVVVLRELGVPQQLPGALVVLVAGRYDWRSVAEGVIAETAKAALAAAAPTVLLADEVMVGRREGMALGISSTYAARPSESLETLGARVARTWSPPPC